MSDWNGLPDQLERSGWHWLKHKQWHLPQPFEWDECEKEWLVDDDDGSPEEMAAYGYEYICPCPTPSELAQMRKGERERCAQVCQDYAKHANAAYMKSSADNEQYWDGVNSGALTCSVRIRALTDDEGKKP